MTRFTDQFLWDVNDPAACPQQFAQQLGRDLGLDQPVVMEVACRLIEQVSWQGG